AVPNPLVLLLDVKAPQVANVQPPQGAVSVPTNASIVVKFSEPVDTATVRSCSGGQSPGQPTLRLLESTAAPPALNDPANPCDDSNVVSVALSVSADSTTATLTPSQGLKSLTQYTLIVNRGTLDANGVLTGGILDLVGQPLDADFVSRFV